MLKTEWGYKNRIFRQKGKSKKVKGKRKKSKAKPWGKNPPNPLFFFNDFKKT
ncbi:MAG: hypothetical protein H7839_02925 [Magnetococcus sp. YQC-5]